MAGARADDGLHLQAGEGDRRRALLGEHVERLQRLARRILSLAFERRLALAVERLELGDRLALGRVRVAAGLGDQRLELAARVGEAAEQAERFDGADVRLEQSGLERDRFLSVGERLVAVVGHQPRRRAVGPVRRVLGRQRDRLRVIVGGGAVLALLVLGVARVLHRLRLRVGGAVGVERVDDGDAARRRPRPPAAALHLHVGGVLQRRPRLVVVVVVVVHLLVRLLLLALAVGVVVLALVVVVVVAVAVHRLLAPLRLVRLLEQRLQLRVRRLQLEPRRRRRDRRRVAAEREQRARAAVVALDVIRVEADRLLRVGERVLRPPEREQRRRAVAEHERVGRLVLQRFRKLCDGLGILLLAEEVVALLLRRLGLVADGFHLLRGRGCGCALAFAARAERRARRAST